MQAALSQHLARRPLAGKSPFASLLEDVAWGMARNAELQQAVRAAEASPKVVATGMLSDVLSGLMT